MTPERPLTCTGLSFDPLPPVPSWPCVLLPHVQIVPSLRNAMLCPPPPASDVVLEEFEVATGELRLLVVPSPSCAVEFSPHAQTVPSSFSARLWPVPVAAPGSTSG